MYDQDADLLLTETYEEDIDADPINLVIKEEQEAPPEEGVKEKRGCKDLLGIYFRDIGPYELMSDKEIIEFYRAIEECKDEQRIKCLKKEITERNLRLVVSIAKKYSNSDMPLLDLIQAGNMGLMKAIDGYDYRLGFKFSTYATKWIQSIITRTISNQLKMIRIPVNLIPKVNRVERVRRELYQQYGRYPTTQEISCESGIKPDEIRAIVKIPQRSISFNQPTRGDSDRLEYCPDLIEVFGDSESDPYDVIDRNFRDEALDKLLGKLDARERKIIELRYGLKGGIKYTQTEIANDLGLSRQRISQIERGILQKLRFYITDDSSMANPLSI